MPIGRFFSYLEPLGWVLASRFVSVVMLCVGAFFSVRSGNQDVGLHLLNKYDAHWYITIAEEGYAADAMQNAFFPLFPLLIRFVGWFGASPLVAGLLISNVALIVASYLFYYLSLQLQGIRETRCALLLWLFFPYSVYVTMPYTESLFAVFFLLSLWAVRTDHLLYSGFVNGIASALRPQGVLLGILLLGKFSKTSWQRCLIALALSITGIAAFIAYLQYAFHNPLEFLHAQRFWRPTEFGWQSPLVWFYMIRDALVVDFQALFINHDIHDLQHNLDVPFMLLAWCFVPRAIKLLGWSAALCCIVMWMLPLATGSLASIGRFTWPMVPIFMATGIVSRSIITYCIVLTVSVIALAVWSFIVGAGHFI